ncbi:MAG: hypothetical protein CVU64_16455 [Deltaproteobacteria bacterium HGW-Deltaproteobacteria-21]|nr:MAG: hypothetical protein CVU64_16455 [Deltaproteobacteria bacterium HGW-Deltaproteobacteria-21]
MYSMLREAGLSETAKKGIPREHCIYVARKRGNDEIAPPDDLYRDFDERKKRLEGEYGKGSDEAHNRAFLECDYERRFRENILKDPEAMKKLESISARSGTRDIYLVCYEGRSKACHRRILLRMAEELFAAEIVIEGVEPKA